MSVTQIQTSGYTDSSVTTAKIANGAVTTQKINFTSALVPVGGIIMWSGTTVPTGWSLCNGSNGTPDLRNRFILGASNTNKTGTTSQAGPGFNVSTGALSANYTPGDIGGSTAHQLTVGEMPPHKHTTNLDDRRVFVVEGPIIVPYGGPGGYPGQIFSMDNTGGNQYHENRPPYYALAFIMRVT